MVDGHEVHLMPSANLAVAMNKIGRLPLSPEVKRARATLKAVAV